MIFASPYDAVPYPGWSHAQSHPDRLATLGTLFGMTPADPAACRVLELGCGDAANALAIAYACPGTRVTGIDLAPSAIDRGREAAKELRLANLELRAGDLARLPDELGEFDYVIAHGVYSWVPGPVRRALLDACRRFLAPQGIAFVSYNAYPGGHLRTMLRDAILMHVEGVDEPDARMSAAREFLAWIREAQGPGSPDSPPGALRGEAARLMARADASLFHDDLADEFHVCYFRDFCTEAEAHGLQFLAEADFFEMHDGGLPAQARRQLESFAPGLVEREQYLDFVKERRFRQTLLCRSGLALRSAVNGDALRTLGVSSSAEPEGGEIDPLSGDEQRYKGRAGASFATSEPLLKVAAGRLRAEWPKAVSFTDLLSHACARCAPGDEGNARRKLADFALGCYASGSVDLHVAQPPFARRPGLRPRASALALRQSRRDRSVTGLIGNTVVLDDPLARRLLAMLDGTRDVAALLRMSRADAKALAELQEAAGGRDDANALARALERGIDALARCALLHDD